MMTLAKIARYTRDASLLSVLIVGIASCRSLETPIQAQDIDPEFASWETAQLLLDQPPLDQTFAFELAFDPYAAAPIIPTEFPESSGPQPLEAADLWRNMRKRMLLDHHTDHKRVKQELAWLKRNPKYLQRLAPRIERYLPYIFEQTQLRDFPAEIALLPIVESALDPFAFSPGGASGPWQFLRGTARQYGLQINDWYDGRRDVIASTQAALDYLTALERRFDDWYLALAGYNAGEGNVARARRKKPGAGFFDLRLPRETQAYVPRLLALADIIANPHVHGITLPDIKPTIEVATIQTHSQFDLNKLSGLLKLDIDDLYEWNPALNQWSTPPKGPHRVLVPASLEIADLQDTVSAVADDERVDWAEVLIRPGDTLIVIAKRHGTDVTSLKQANNLASHRIRAGKKLLIPKNSHALTNIPRKSRGATVGTHLVRSGDSLWSISRQYDVSLTSLMKANDLGPKDTLAVGHKVVVPGQTTSGRSVVRKVRYKVRSGDSLSRIATKFKVSVQEIARWNDLDPKRYLQPGQRVLLYVNVIAG